MKLAENDIMEEKEMKSLNLIVCAIFAILAAAAIIVDYLNLYPNFSGYLCNLAVECLGVILTLIVIQKVLEKHNESKEKQAERKNILKRNEIIMAYIEFYKRFFHCVATPLENRFDKETFSFPMKFSIKDMLQDLYGISGYTTNALLKPSIELFFTHEENLKNAFIAIINSIEFKHYPKIKELALDYIKNSVRNDMRDFILNNKHLTAGEQKFEELVKTLIPTIEENYKSYTKSELKANLATPYCILYDLMNTEQNIIAQYVKEIEKLQKEQK